MSLGGNSPGSPQFSDVGDDLAEPGALQLLSVGRLRISVAYAVPFAAGILCVSVGIATWLPGGTADLPPSAAAATAFWVSGWLIQAVAFVALCWLFGNSARTLRFGLLGIELAPQAWSARRATMLAFGTVLPILLLGMFYRWVEGGFRMPQFAPAEQSTWLPPSLGFKPHESIWLTGAWLCWVQAVLQMIPFPRTPGRLLLASLVVGMGGQLPETIQCRLFRQMLVLLSIGMVAATLPLIASDDPAWSSKWPLVMVAAVLLWASSRRSDIGAMISSMQRRDPVTRQRVTGNWLDDVRRPIAEWRIRKRLNRAMRREHGEASDAKQLDEILNRLHREGYDSLSQDDRRILDRVSKNLRRQRDESETVD